MPQTQSQIWRVGAMVESRSLVSETKHGANRANEARSLVSAGVRFEKPKIVGVSHDGSLEEPVVVFDIAVDRNLVQVLVCRLGHDSK